MTCVHQTKSVRIWQGEAHKLLRWVPEGSVRLCYIDPPYMTQKVQKGHSGSYSDVWRDRKAYLEWLYDHLAATYDVLKPNGSLMVHVDQRVVHDVAVMLSEIYPVQVNDIIWCYQSGGAGKRHLAKKHDTILWYAKSNEYVFNVIREPYPNDYGDRPGFHPEGRMLNDWWQIPILSTTASERVGYPNQKPLPLLDRCVRLASNQRDIVLDYFCGSGTTAVAALLANRRVVIGDNNPDAVAHALERLRTL